VANIRTLKLNLLADTDNFSKGLKKASGQSDDFSANVKKNMKTLAKSAAIAGAAVAGMAIAFGVDAVKAAIADQKSQKTLQNSLKNTVKATNAQVKATERWITKQQFAYGVSDDKLRPALAKLTAVTGSLTKGQDLLSLGLDISAGSGKDLEAVTKILTAAQNGNLSGLKKLGVPLDAATIKNKDLATALQQTAAQFKGAAAANAGTFAGKLEIFNQRISEAKEQIGSAILDALQPLADEWLPKIASGVEGFIDGLTGIKKKGDPAYESVKKWGEKAKEIVTWLGDHTELLKNFGKAVAAIFVIGKINAAVTTITTAVGLMTAAYSRLAGTAAAAAEAQTASNIAAAGGTAGAGIAARIAGLLRLVPLAGLAYASKGSTKDPYTDAELAKYQVNEMKKLKGWTQAQANAWGASQGFAGYSTTTTPPPSNFKQSSYGMGQGHTVINLNGIVDAESARRSIESLMQTSGLRTGAVNLNRVAI